MRQSIPRPDRRSLAPAIATGVLALATLTATLSACQRDAQVVDYCVEHPGECPPCSNGDDCVFMGNSCLSTVVCAHRETDLAFVQIGCSSAQEYSWPPDDQCRCVDTVCTYYSD